MVFPHRPIGFADGPAPIPVYGWDLSEELSTSCPWQAFRPRRGRDEPGRQSRAGLSYQGKPRWFSLIGRSASPMGLLPFRYTVGTYLKSFPQAALGRRFRPRRGRDEPGRRSKAGLRHEGKPRSFSLIGRSASPPPPREWGGVSPLGLRSPAGRSAAAALRLSAPSAGTRRR